MPFRRSLRVMRALALVVALVATLSALLVASPARAGSCIGCVIQEINGLIDIATTSMASGQVNIAWNPTAYQGITMEAASTTFNGSPIIFLNSSGGTSGWIGQSASAVVYNTSSDRRLKENIAPSSRGLDTLLRIPVDDFNFIADPKKIKVQGFIAQDLYELYPEAVAVGGDDPKKKPWAVDYGRVTPLLIKAIQELKSLFDSDHDMLAKDHDEITKLKADNDNLRARVDALEAK
jgi:Chaperone of endosialidase